MAIIEKGSCRVHPMPDLIKLWMHVRAGFICYTCPRKEIAFMRTSRKPGGAGQTFLERPSEELETCSRQAGDTSRKEPSCGLNLHRHFLCFPPLSAGFNRENITFCMPSLYRAQWDRAISTMSQVTQDRRTKQQKKKEVMQKIKNIRKQDKLKKETMSDEAKMVWRLQKTNRKIAILYQKLKKYELPEDEVSQHDPEIITQEQLQALKKIGYKNKNYVPVGRRGIYGGTIQNMHMHWKKHETVQVDCHMFPKERIKSMAQELARLSGGIVIDIHQATTVILYRGKNYRQPKVLIPPNLLDKRKALFKSKYEQALASLEDHAKKVDKELAKLRMQSAKAEGKQLTGTKEKIALSRERFRANLDGGEESEKACDKEGWDDWDEEEYELYEPSELESDSELEASDSSELESR
ncbi:hypothetical protein O6H91_01G128100 [Diphasiastrum complanatum]|uniref:Uncharacterized protein n=1 Tax=Diphasiastrum complanatum TaxID=34168 RepID=A0ACC2EVS7_DIPCM|nr:hypothetical protein O6H91_01G128100 [Diphasiastrum complanatum]